MDRIAHGLSHLRITSHYTGNSLTHLTRSDELPAVI